jgi:hypothetical protein
VPSQDICNLVRAACFTGSHIPVLWALCTISSSSIRMLRSEFLVTNSKTQFEVLIETTVLFPSAKPERFARPNGFLGGLRPRFSVP